MPYHQSQYFNNPVVQRALELSMKRLILFDAEYQLGYWYLGDRCWRQTTGEIVLPFDPPSRSSLSSVPHQVYIQYRAAGWELASLFIVPANEKIYKRYWRHVAPGAVVSSLRRVGNHDQVSVGASQDPTFQIPYQAGGTSVRFTYDQFPLGNPHMTSTSDWQLPVAGYFEDTVGYVPVASREPPTVFESESRTHEQWASYASEQHDLIDMLKQTSLETTRRLRQTIRNQDSQIVELRMNRSGGSRTTPGGSSSQGRSSPASYTRGECSSPAPRAPTRRASHMPSSTGAQFRSHMTRAPSPIQEPDYPQYSTQFTAPDLSPGYRPTLAAETDETGHIDLDDWVERVQSTQFDDGFNPLD